MDPNSLARALLFTFSGNGQQRQQAEAAIKGFQKKPGYQATLLQIVGMQNRFDFPVRQAATIQLKNIIVRQWSVLEPSGPNSIIISPKDREFIKKHLLSAIVQQSNQKIRVQLLECLLHVCRTDFPEKYGFLLEEIMNNILKSNNPQKIYGALCALRMVFKNYEYRSKKDLTPLPKLVESTFPALINVFNGLMQTPNQNKFEMIRMLIKIFRISTYLSIPKYLRTPQTLGPWLEAIIRVVNSPLVGISGIPKDEKELKTIPQVKCKKWGLQCMTNMYKRFGQEILAEKTMKPFARMFDQTYSKGILKAMVNILQHRVKGAPVTDRMTHICFGHLSTAINHAHMYKLIRPELRFLVADAVVSCMTLTEQDIALWREDPSEYIRKDMDIMEETHDPKISSMEFLFDLVKIRTADALPLTMNIVKGIFETYARAAPQQRDYRKKEAGMRILGQLSRLVLSDEKMSGPIEGLITMHVLPEFKSQAGFMRARACAVVGSYVKLEFRNKKAFAGAIQMVCECLTSQELPLKLQAVKAMSRVVKNDDVVEFVKPHLAKVLNEYFKLIDDVPNEEVVETLEILIAHVKEEVGPFAVSIAERMARLFINILNNTTPDDDEKAFTALQCLRVLNTLLHVCAPLRDKAQVFGNLCKVYQPVIERCMREDAHEFLEDSLDVVSALVKFCFEMNPFLWSLVPKIIDCYKNYAVDHVQNVVVALGNYIAFAPIGLSKRPQTIQAMLKMVAWTFYPTFPQGRGPDNPRVAEIDYLIASQYAAKTITMLLLHIKEKMDGYLPDICKLLFKKLASTTRLCQDLQKEEGDEKQFTLPKAQALKIILIESMATALSQNPAIFMKAASSAGCTRQVFKVWMDNQKEIANDPTTLGISIMGLSSIARLPGNGVPPELVQDKYMLHLLNGAVGQLKELERIEEKEDGEENTDDDDDSEPEIQKFENVDISKDAIVEEDVENLKGWAQQIQEIRDAFQDYGAHSDSYLDEFFTPAHETDKYEYFAKCIVGLGKANPGAQQAWMQVLSSQQRQIIEQLVKKGKDRAEKKSSDGS
mmetsp:Transcript_16250/g.40027  ORF Transcript_16250/g.40027 Transcript_16250/m.40027 type:complete len:1050 (+) Transcript_16250:159-3308(+)